MENIKRFIECLLPTTVCNLKCDYCYLIQENRRSMKVIELDYSVHHIINCLTKERMGGVCYFSLCGAGETFIQKECRPLVKGLLKEGHYVNITNNGTMTNELKLLIKSLAGEERKRLHLAFSLHYIELKNKNLLDLFFSNVNYVKERGISFVVQLNLYDKYIEYLDEIKKKCLKELGALPQVALTRKENTSMNFEILTNLSNEEYFKIGNEFNSELFRFTYENFNKKRKEFCYAGLWSMTLDLKTGILRDCYASIREQNIFKNLDKKIKFKPIGCNCRSRYCINSSHFMALGVIPSLDTPSYCNLRNRIEANWYNKEMKEVLSKQFKDYHKQYNSFERVTINYSTRVRKYMNSLIYYCKVIKNKIERKE